MPHDEHRRTPPQRIRRTRVASSRSAARYRDRIAAVVFTAGVVWFGYVGDKQASIRWSNAGYSIASPTEATTTFDVYLYDDDDATCRVRALNARFAEVGYADVAIVRSDGTPAAHRRRHRHGGASRYRRRRLLHSPVVAPPLSPGRRILLSCLTLSRKEIHVTETTGLAHPGGVRPPAGGVRLPHGRGALRDRQGDRRAPTRGRPQGERRLPRRARGAGEARGAHRAAAPPPRERERGRGPAGDGEIASGMVVTAEVAGREMRFLVGSREAAGGTDIDVFSAQSPLGRRCSASARATRRPTSRRTATRFPVTIIATEPFSG